jgi:hypothetical protein
MRIGSQVTGGLISDASNLHPSNVRVTVMRTKQPFAKLDGLSALIELARVAFVIGRHNRLAREVLKPIRRFG